MFGAVGGHAKSRGRAAQRNFWPGRRLAGTLATLGALALCPSSAIAAELFVSTGGHDANPCTAAAPCRSFERAYQSAAPGQVVEVAAGEYGEESIPVDVGKAPATSRVVFVPAPGAAVGLADLSVYGTHAEVRDLRIDAFAMREGARDVVLRNVHINGTFAIRSGADLSILGGEVGPAPDGVSFISAAYESSVPARNILIDGVEFHDYVKVTDGAHVDCLSVDEVVGLTIRNSRFRNCEHFAILFGKDSSTQRGASNVLVENNFFDCCRSGYYSLGFQQFEGGTVRFNSTNKAFGFLGGPVTGLTLSSNVLPNVNDATCDLADWRYNVIGEGARCGPGDRIAPSGFVDAGALDFHLRKGAAAIDAGDPAAAPTTDIDGGPRQAGKPDAGADEYGSTAANQLPPGAPSLGAGPVPATRGPGVLVRPPELWRRERGSPRASLVLLRVSLRTFLRRGLPLRVTCSKRCSVLARGRVGRRTARRWQVSRALARSRTRPRPAGRAITLRLKPSRRNARRLRRARRLSITVYVQASDRQGRAARTKARLTLRR